MKETAAACWLHAAPIGNGKKRGQRVLPPFETERNGGRCVAYTPPPFEKKRNGGSVWDSRCPHLKQKETGGDVACTPVRNETGAACGFHAPPFE